MHNYYTLILASAELIFHSIQIKTSSEKKLEKSLGNRYGAWYMFWYLPTCVTYAKILAHVRDDVERFYGNCKLEFLSYNSILENPWPY